MRIYHILILMIALVLCQAARAATIEYNYFEPDRSRSSRIMYEKWGPHYTWPLKTFPRSQAASPDMLTESYGLVYWPGEEVTVHITGDDAEVDAVTCENVSSDDTLPTGKINDTTWRIPIPENEDPHYLQIYRVKAFSGDKLVASRGLIVTRPWSGIRPVNGDPFFPMCGVSFGEWANGSNPWCVMSFMVGYHTFVEDYVPMKNRPWGGTDVFGLAEIHNWPRLKGKSVNKPRYTSQDYADPTLDWNAWWIYYGRGVSKWRGEWQWGPFSMMSAEHITDRHGTYDYGICYGHVKQYSAPYPNGLLFWQWGYYGLEGTAAHMMACRRPQFTYDTYDGWEEGLGDEGRSEEVGMMSLYYKRCKSLGLSTSWTEEYPYFAAFKDAEWEKYRNDDPLNDFHLRYRSLDLNRKNFYMYELATNNAYREVTGKERDYYGGAIGQPGMIDRAAFAGLRRDKRWTGALWNDPFNNGRGGHQGTGNDYSHTGVVNVGSDWFKKSRWYRGYGYNGGTLCALWPQMYYGGGHNHNDVMPLRPDWKRTAPGWRLLNNFLIDGTSYRRMDLFERATMFYRPGGDLTSYELAFCFGGSHSGSDNSSYSEIPEWNTQAVLGDQVMEIPDRTRPIGGVLVFDSNNADAREQKQEFLTQRPFSDLIAALHDELGVITYANPDTEKDIPADIPIIYAPRKMGSDQPVLAARVGGKTITVPYNGPQDQLPTSETFQNFVQQIKAAFPGVWPITTTGGFVAAGWESSNGVFVVVENPMSADGQIHTARTGSVTVRIRGLQAEPPVIDLCGDSPDPQRIPKENVSINGEYVTFSLDWPKGDARLFWIDAALPE